MTNAAGTPVTVTLSNARSSPLPLAQPPGPQPSPLRLIDVYKDAGTVEATITKLKAATSRTWRPTLLQR
ncbi:hypothetical protein [Pseudomonas sp. LD120]|uniref:hypothetical protein n=1 Tax=Pseudomonas sp. LD120 TaxID=485751 RepID=UPI003531C1BC